MAKLTAKQVNELANSFLAMAQAVGDYRYLNYDSITKGQKQKLKSLHWSVLQTADDLYTLSASLTLDDAQTALEAIDKISKDMKASYKKLKDVQKAIKLATSMVVLGSAVLSKNPFALLEAIDAFDT